ncbi:hypothetical protein C8Q73DRAFT_791473 [Cubamyces lactineus]|nr:hypothetical protein C8Q73DRAFT_791473 [Cubamyces lactineus]
MGELREHLLPSTASPTTTETARFLGPHNPAQVKRTVLASFTDVLLFPVTIVPRTVGKAVRAAITTGSSTAVQGIATLNPQRWSATGVSSGTSAGGFSSSGGGGGGGSGGGVSPFARMSSWGDGGSKDGYGKDFEKGGDDILCDIGGDDEDEAEATKGKGKEMDTVTTARCKLFPWLSAQITDVVYATSLTVSTSQQSSTSTSTAATSLESTRVPTPNSAPTPSASTFSAAGLDHLDLLLLLDTASCSTPRSSSSTPTASRSNASRRSPATQARPGHDRGDIRAPPPGTGRASHQAWVRDGHRAGEVELAPHIDKTDFLNSVVHEKKHFEDVLDDCVTVGLNNR